MNAFSLWLDSLSDCEFVAMFLLAWAIVGLAQFAVYGFGRRLIDEDRYLLEEAASLQDMNRSRERLGLPILYDARIDQYRRQKGA